MLLTELNMLILQFVVLIFLFTIFTVLHIYKMFFFKHYNLLTKSQKTLDYLLWITLDTEYEIRGGNLRMATTFWRENGRKGEEVSSEQCQKLRRFSIRCSLFFCLYRLHTFFSPQISSPYEGNVKEQMLFMYGEKPNIRLTLRMAALFILSR